MTTQAFNSNSVEDFLAELETIGWFDKIGQSVAETSGVVRIHSWEEWPGPEALAILKMSLSHQALYDSIMSNCDRDQAALRALWDRIHDIVFRTACPKVPFDPRQDAWHGPTTAVWQAAWTAGLIGLCLRAGRPIPPELEKQWEWFVRGHWPSGYASLNDKGEMGPVLLF